MSEVDRENELQLRIQEGEALLKHYDQWAEDIRREVCKLDQAEEIRIQEDLKEWLRKAIPLEDPNIIKVANEVLDLLLNWKTPKLYICKSMRKQIITGPGAQKLKEMFERARQKGIQPNQTAEPAEGEPFNGLRVGPQIEKDRDKIYQALKAESKRLQERTTDE